MCYSTYILHFFSLAETEVPTVDRIAHNSSGSNLEKVYEDENDIQPQLQIMLQANFYRQFLVTWVETDIHNIIRWYINGVLLVFGLLSNLFCLIVLQTGNLKKSSSRWSLSVFNAVDLSIIGFVLFPKYVADVTGFYHDQSAYCKINNYLQYLLLFLSPWMAVFVTLERVFVIQYPLKARNFTTSIKIAIMNGIFLFWALVFIFVPVLYEKPVYHGNREAEEPIFNLHILAKLKMISLCTSDATNSPLFQIQPLILPIFHFFIPFIVLLIGNCVILHELRSGTKKLANMLRLGQMLEERLKQERAVTIRVFTAGITFLILMIPGSSYSLLMRYAQGSLNNFIKDHFSLQRQMFFMVLDDICQSCYFLNSSINFVIYIVSGKEFRKQSVVVLVSVFNKLTQLCRKPPQEPTSSAAVIQRTDASAL